ncbi:MAG TPA: M28 family peptidase [Pyrinomonadaceae bacterium]|nr:M28 family peptidase [Pyrinomonadaceae bacterium]
MLFVLLGLGLVGFASWFWMTQPLLTNASSLNTPVVDPAVLKQHVVKLSQELGPRDEAHLENLDRVAAYIKEEFQKTGARVSEQPYRVEGKSYRNVIAQFGPTTGKRLVIGAHYDTAGPLPGADDNASGVAGLLELARLFDQQPPKILVELVAFTLEEPPYFRTTGMGSSVHANSLREQHAEVVAMISLEMIGYFNDAESSQHFPSAILQAFYPSRGDFIAVVGRVGDGLITRRLKAAMLEVPSLKVRSINAPAFIPGIDFSDQLNYWHAGYRAVMVTDTAFYRNLNYHTVNDTAEKLDYKRMALVVAGVHATVAALSE